MGAQQLIDIPFLQHCLSILKFRFSLKAAQDFVFLMGEALK